MKKILSIIVCMVVLVGCVPIHSFATEKVVPYDNNTLSTYSVFNIDDNGTASIFAEYVGYIGITTGATIKTKIEKRFLLVFWNEVASWTDEVVGDYYSNTHSTTVKKGTYRATVEYTIRGTGGEPDVIVDEYEYTYE